MAEEQTDVRFERFSVIAHHLSSLISMASVKLQIKSVIYPDTFHFLIVYDIVL